MKKPNLKPFFKSLLRIFIILVASLSTSQIATTNPAVDSIVKAAIVETSNVLVTALSSDPTDTVIVLTATVDAESQPQTNN